MAGPLKLEFVMSATRTTDLPGAPAEVALVGRSNVGKSSLLNALAGRRQLAHTSKTPGRTQQLNCYRLPDGSTLVDCPGYGYAKASKADRARWMRMIERYLLEREELVMVLALVDGEVGPTALDLGLFEWLRANDLPFTVVATKHDKVKASQREKRKKELAERCGVERREVVWVSAEKGVNIDHLRALVHDWLTES